jgi:hypothetical protein
MLYPGFIGPSYQSRSLFADAEQCVNLYPESVESGNGKNNVVLYPTPGLLQANGNGQGGYSTLPNCCIMAAKTVWSTNDARMYSYVLVITLEADKTQRTIRIYRTIDLNLVASYTWPSDPPQCAFMATNGKQLLMAVNDELFCWDMTASSPSIVPVTTWTPAPITGLDFLDGFFTVTTSSALYCSAQGDGMTWDALNFVTETDEPDGIVGHIVDHRLIWIFGKSRVEAYYNAGGADFPFQRVPQGVMEIGCASAACVVPAAESLFWVGIGKNGGPIVYRNNGYTPVRVSTHAIEQILQKYITVSDTVGLGRNGYAGTTSNLWAYQAARGYSYTENGHVFVVFNFGGINASLLAAYGYTPSQFPPDPTTTLVYDVTEGLWHERQYANGDGTFVRHLANFFFYDQEQGFNVVTDYRNQLMYVQRLGTWTDNGASIWRWRIAPHLATENKWMFYSKFTLDFGIDTTQGFPNTIYLQWSDDGGTTWSTQSVALWSGVPRAIWRRLGKSRNRIFKVSTSMQGQFVWINAFLELQPGNS